MVSPGWPPRAVTELADLVRCEPVPLGEAAIAVAAYLGYADDPAWQLQRLADLAAGVPGDDLVAVAHHLFTTAGLRGATASYYDPLNSMLPLVLDRRRGIPVTLAVIAVDVARRLNIEASVVGMPGHVLVGDGDPPHRWIDVFHGGQWVDALGARARFATIHGRHAPFDPRALSATPDPHVIARLLGNLVGIYASTGDAHRLVRVHELRTAIPGLAESERPALATALTSVGRYEEAAVLWELESAGRSGPEAAEAAVTVRRLRSHLN